MDHSGELEPSSSPASPRSRALSLLRRWGWNATGFQGLEEGFHYYFDRDDACVAYVDTGRAWVVAGAPIGPHERIASVVRNFVARAEGEGRRVCFFAVEERFVERTGLPAILVGEQPTWDPRRWERTLSSRPSLREQLRRARAKGVRVRRVPTEEIVDPKGKVRLAFESLVATWVGTRAMPRMRFLVDVQLFSFPEERRYFAAEREGVVEGFLVAVPIFARDGWLIEDLVRAPAAPNGTAELLVHEAMTTFAHAGASYATLGLAPLSGAVPRRLGVFRRWASGLYDFEGIRAFKSKLGPHTWDPVYLAHPHDGSANVALYDVLAAFAGGSFVGFGVKTLLRGPAIVLRALAVLLVPWTILLATASPSWFPSRAVQGTWVVFDVMLGVILFFLALRWRRWLGVALASVVTVDATLTCIEATFYNLPRAHSLTTFVVLGAACLGPSLGALALWGAVKRDPTAHVDAHRKRAAAAR
ncbi:MAG: DUF2156 domain-containing protein [Polyangiaceae bacterium]